MFIPDQLISNRKVFALCSLRSTLEAEAFLLSPAELGVLISLKHTKEKSVETLHFNALFVVAGTGLEPATSGL